MEDLWSHVININRHTHLYNTNHRNHRLKKNKTKKALNAFVNVSCHPTKRKIPKKSLKWKTTLSGYDMSCLDTQTLRYMRNMWNKRHPDDKITSKAPHHIWKNLQSRLIKTCKNEQCWVDNIVKSLDKQKNIKKKLFAPKSPVSWKSNINEWLSSTDIINVMKQYEEKHKDFHFIGPSPIDFNEMYEGSCVWPELCNFQIHDMKKRKKHKIGFIFNLDPHYKPGSHWVAMFLDLNKKMIFYFDSNGTDIPNEIAELVKTIQFQCEKYNIIIQFDSNKGVTHQKSNTECGMFSLFFITQLLENNYEFEDFKHHGINDKQMEEFRSIYFNI
jgi:hypothetical protein